GSDSAQAKDLVDQRLGKQTLNETLIIRNENLTADSPEFQKLADDLAGRIGAVKGVTSVATYTQTGASGMVSSDRHAALVNISLGTKQTQAEKDVVGVVDIAKGANGQDGFSVYLAGAASSSHEINKISEDDLSSE